MIRRHKQWCLAGALAAFLTTACQSTTAPISPTSSPDAARLFYDDIARFWVAFDKIQSSADTLPLRVDYLDPGTAGLHDFTEARWRTARNLTAMIWPHRPYYESIRQNTLAVSGLEPALRANFKQLAMLYPEAVFPDVYFAIGGLSTGGTTSRRGLLIGTELFSRDPASPLQSLTPWQRSVVRSPDVLPAIVVHELIHYQQRFKNTSPTLLAQAITEGSADFLSELITGKSINLHLDLYAEPREAELWAEFSRVMNGNDVTRWLYNGGTVTDSASRPADLGYWVGARITRGYYERSTDKRAAVRDILTIRDFNDFLSRSGYADRF
jgi:hypothetical protein